MCLHAQLFLDLVDDGIHLTTVRRRRNDEVVRHADEIADFLHHEIGGFLLISRARRNEGAFP